MPTLLQASISKVPAGAVIFLPSTVRFTSFAASAIKLVIRLRHCWLGHHRLLKWTRPSVQMIFKLLTELLDESHGRHRCGITQRAKCSAQHVFRQVIHVIDVFLYSATIVETDQRLLQPVGTFPAGNAPATALMLIKLHSAQCEFHDAGCVVEYDNA